MWSLVGSAPIIDKLTLDYNHITRCTRRKSSNLQLPDDMQFTESFGMV